MPRCVRTDRFLQVVREPRRRMRFFGNRTVLRMDGLVPVMFCGACSARAVFASPPRARPERRTRRPADEDGSEERGEPALAVGSLRPPIDRDVRRVRSARASRSVGCRLRGTTTFRRPVSEPAAARSGASFELARGCGRSRRRER